MKLEFKCESRRNVTALINLKNILENNWLSSYSAHGVIGDVYFRYSIINYDLPLIIYFSHMGTVLSDEQINNDEFIPSDFKFLLEKNLNVITFYCIDEANWYRNYDFHRALESLGPLFLKFNLRLGYGGSMGGFGVSAFANILNLNRVLLFSPISSLNKSIAGWETRFKNRQRKYSWIGKYHDGSELNCSGYIVYDPLFKLDALHAKRYSKLTHLKVPGVGHAMGEHLQCMGILKWLFDSFLGDTVNEVVFRRRARRRFSYQGYYKHMLSKSSLTPKRREIVSRYYNNLMKSNEDSRFELFEGDPDLLRDYAIKLEAYDLKMSEGLMALAHRMRPTGPTIKKKLEQYRKK